MSLQDELERIAKELQDEVGGQLGVAVRHLPSGEQWSVNGDTLFPLASVFKVPLLVEVMAQVGEGRYSLETRLTLEDGVRSPGSGVLRELQSGLALTVRDLATLAIIISDNTATDMLMGLVGGRRGAINRRLRQYGIGGISVPEDCRGLLLMCAGFSPDDRSPERLAEVTERLRREEYDWDSPAFRPDPAVNNVASPRGLAGLFTALQEGTILDADGCRTVLDICRRQQLNQRIPALLPTGTRVAHKTGTIGWTRNDAGIIYLPDGSPLVFCAMTQRVPPDRWQAGDQAIARAARAAYDRYA